MRFTASLRWTPLTDLQTAIPDFPDVTSLLAGTIIQTGVVGLAELLLIVALAISALLEARRGTDRDYHAATVALTAQFAGLVGVTLITNYEFFFWALVAYVATAHQRHAAARQAVREHTDAGNLTRRGGAGVIQSAGT